MDERFQNVEVLLRRAVRTYMKLKGSRRRKKVALAEYNLGVASGVIKTLDLLGYGTLKEDILRQLDREFPSPAERWFGISRAQRYLGPR
jgi:hypothetical protein